MAIMQEVCFTEDHRAVQQEKLPPRRTWAGLSKKFWSRVVALLLSTTEVTTTKASSKNQVTIWVKLVSKSSRKQVLHRNLSEVQ